MTHVVALIAPVLAIGLLHGHAPSSPHAGIGQRQDVTGGITISRAQEREKTRGPADRFTGTVQVEMLAQPPSPSRASAASVSFEPGARSAWHTHPLSQTLIVTVGSGGMQEEGSPRRRRVEPHRRRRQIERDGAGPDRRWVEARNEFERRSRPLAAAAA